MGSILDQMSGSALSSGSKRIFEVVYCAVLFRGRAVTGASASSFVALEPGSGLEGRDP
jgi:hypothetical protein